MKDLKKELENAREEVDREKRSRGEMEAELSTERKKVAELKNVCREGEEERRQLKEEMGAMQGKLVVEVVKYDSDGESDGSSS